MSTPPPLPPSTPPQSPLPPVNTQPFSFGGYVGIPEGIEGVGFWPRVGARVIDWLVYLIANLLAGIVFGIGLTVYAGMTGQSFPLLVGRLQQTTAVNYVFALLAMIAYHATCESVHGSTLGKLALSMVVVQEDGSPCRFGPAVIRSGAFFVDSLFFGLIGYFAMQKNPQQQRLGDQWAHTIVCKRSSVAQQNIRSGGRFALALLLGVMAAGAIAMIGLLIRVAS